MPELQAKLGLAASQRGRIQAIQSKYMAGAFGGRPGGPGGPGRPGPGGPPPGGPGGFGGFAQIFEKMGNEMLSVLTPQQRTKFHALQGKPFKRDPSQDRPRR